jgi:Dual specificity phosphatase, catalytic domain
MTTQTQWTEIDEDLGIAPQYEEIDYPTNLWDEILPNLFQGGTDDDDTIWEKSREGARITKDDFDVVITAYQYANPADWLVKEVRYPFYDSPNMSGIDFKELFQVVRIAHEDWKSGKKVLIRCQAGLNRSGLITALVLMREGYSAEEAICLIRDKRSGYALFNSTFEKWLLSLPAKGE